MARTKIGPLDPAYQPIIKIATGEVFGYEALIRGRGEFKNPLKLFNDSYEKGYTVQLDHACLKKNMKILSKLGKKQHLFVNSEPITFYNSYQSWTKENSFLSSKEWGWIPRAFVRFKRGR